MKIENTCLTNMIMIYNNNKILVIDRIKKDWPGITFPGGHIEYNESFKDSAIREVKEETGLIIDEIQFCGIKQFQIKKDIRYIVFLYKSNKYHGELTNSEEGRVFWIDKKDLNKYNLSNGFEDMIEIFENDLLYELYYRYNGEKIIY